MAFIFFAGRVRRAHHASTNCNLFCGYTGGDLRNSRAVRTAKVLLTQTDYRVYPSEYVGVLDLVQSFRGVAMKKFWILPVFILTLFAVSVSAEESFDAKILRIEGVVLAHQGELYQTAREGMLLQAGDRLMIMEAAELKLTYHDGCVFTFKGGQVIEISKVSTCEGAQAFVKATTPMNVHKDAPGAPVIVHGPEIERWVLPAAIVTAVVAVVALSGSSSSSTPASP